MNGVNHRGAAAHQLAMTNRTRAGGPPPLISLILGGALAVLLVAIVISSGLFDDEPGVDPSPTPSQVALASGSPTASPSAIPSASAAAAGGTASVPPTAAPTTVPATLAPSPSDGGLPSEPPTSPAPSPSPSPGATAAPTAVPQTAFRQVEGFPAEGERVAAITSGGPGFVAVGYADNPTPECVDRVDGRIWTSPDGEHWTRQAEGALDEARMWGVVDASGTLYAFGYVGLPGDCVVPDEFGNHVWRSSDGIAWERVTSGISSASQHDRWNDVAVAGDTLVVVGRFGESGDGPERGGGVWTSTNGIDWLEADRTPRTYNLVSVAARGSTVVAFGEDPSDGMAWYSNDAGRTWRRGAIEGGWNVWQADLSATDGGFLAVARACCGLPQRSVGLSLTSADGRTWTPGPGAHRFAGERGLLVPGGVLALTDAPETRISTDGLTWLSGPTAPPLNPDHDFITAAAAGAPGVVLVAHQGVGGDSVVRAWFAPIAEFDPARWTSPPQAADWPVVGERYRYELYTHCGAANTRVVFAGSVWLMDESTLQGRFGDPDDRGHLTMLSPDRALYEGRRGGSFELSRTDTPPPWPRCA